MRIFITGIAGYVGSALEQHFKKQGHEVSGLDLVEDKFAKSFLVKDVKDVQPEDIEGYDAVIHLAGLSKEPTGMFSPLETFRTNHLATERLVNITKELGIKFVYASSCSVYFTYETSSELMTEDSEINPISPYSMSKRASEEAIQEADPNAVILRKGTIYGWALNLRKDLVFNRFVLDGKYKGEITVHSNGKIYRPMLDIQDAVWAYEKALTGEGGIYNVVTENVDLVEKAEEVKDLFKLNLDYQYVGITRNYLASNEKFKRAFKWERQRELSDALQELWQKV